MISVERAFELLAETVAPLEAESVPTSEALHRVAAAPVEAPISLPPFAQSAMDGYVFRSEDTRDASAEEPARLEVAGEISAGPSEPPPPLAPGTAMRIFTGGPVPEGGDTVVRQERIRRSGDEIVFEDPVSAGGDLRPVGEELERATTLADAGTRLDERHLAALSMTGIDRVSMHARPTIALLVSGDEVVPASADLQPGQIYDANAPFLAALLARNGHADVETRHIEDDANAVADALDRAWSIFDLVVTTGGVSVGDYDFVAEASDRAGGRRIFWNVDQKPGRPVLFAIRDQTPLLGLPGNPGAVFVDAHLYLLRLLDRLEGASELRPNLRTGRLTAPVERSSRPRWSPCQADLAEDATLELTPLGSGRAHRLGESFRADALARIEPGDGHTEPDTTVDWLPTR